MIARVDWHGQVLDIDLSAGRSIAISLDPNGPQPSFFTEHPASAKPLRTGDYVGDIRQGGSCNASVVELVPHCHGTHTECRGHVEAANAAVQDTIYAGPVLARLVSIAPAESGATHPEITREDLATAMQGDDVQGAEALIIRTLPNDPARQSRNYAEQPGYAVLDKTAMDWLVALPLKHLLLDAPSLDVAHDGGKLGNHKAWWGLDGRPDPDGIEAGRRSVTEMIFVPDDIPDGLYWLHLELSPLLGDATPSRPMLYPLELVR